MQVGETYLDSLSEEEKQRLIAYLIVASYNQNYRSMIMDGEAACVISGDHSLVAIFDMFFIAGLTTWVEDLDTLEQLLPSYSDWEKWLGRYLMKAL